ncbi:hypothetical protein evm_006409 [Chilo suppressalis]|nr:hypothetical protein evm_006409 [Chilo suppressalis]
MSKVLATCILVAPSLSRLYRQTVTEVLVESSIYTLLAENLQNVCCPLTPRQHLWGSICFGRHQLTTRPAFKLIW